MRDMSLLHATAKEIDKLKASHNLPGLHRTQSPSFPRTGSPVVSSTLTSPTGYANPA